MSLRVLITNSVLAGYTGTEMYVRDLALELRRQGHAPAVFARWLGSLADELRSDGITVTDCLKRLDFHPDIIHGHHRYETLSAIMRFPGTPAIFVCHDHNWWTDEPPLHSRILRYFGVSDLCIARLLCAGIPEVRTGRLYNFVDLKRFKPRSPLPARPRRALLFSNYAVAGSYVPAVAEACRMAGLELTIIGAGFGNETSSPEDALSEYDLVFAKAKAAMEAMAVGASVVLCDYGGVGPMVTSANFEKLRPLNFGYQALVEEHTPGNLLRQIEQYDAPDAARVRDAIRSCQGLEQAVQTLAVVYTEVVQEFHANRCHGSPRDLLCWVPIARGRLACRIKALWLRLPAGRRADLLRLAGMRPLERGFQRLFRGKQKDGAREALISGRRGR